MAITDLTGTKWLLEQGWTATSGFGQFSISGVIYDTNDSLIANDINGFRIGYIGFNFDSNLPVPGSNGIYINFYPTVLTPTYYYEFEITGGDVTNTTLISWLENNAVQIIENKKDMYVGGNKVSKVMVGDKAVTKIMLGDKVIY